MCSLWMNGYGAWVNYFRAGKFVGTSGWFSEEYAGGADKRQVAPIAGMMCSSHYCDLKQFITIYEDSSVVVTNTGYWTPWFSSGHPNSASCPNNMLMNGVQCKGHYCSEMRLQCGLLASGYRVDANDAKDSKWFSENDVVGLCDDGYYARGLICSGDFCDFVKLRCVRVDKLN